MPGSTRPVLAQFPGGALVGYGIANWTARGSALGGIYGRKVVSAMLKKIVSRDVDEYRAAIDAVLNSTPGR